jgi:proteasome activator subunit 4
VEISQYIMIGELASAEETIKNGVSTEEDITPGKKGMLSLPSFKLDDVGYFESSDVPEDDDMPLADDEEDKLLRESTAGFADWVASFVRRVILLLENLPEEGVTGNFASGASECKYLSIRSQSS